jgi:hypothetical protein
MPQLPRLGVDRPLRLGFGPPPGELVALALKLGLAGFDLATSLGPDERDLRRVLRVECRAGDGPWCACRVPPRLSRGAAVGYGMLRMVQVGPLSLSRDS